MILDKDFLIQDKAERIRRTNEQGERKIKQSTPVKIISRKILNPSHIVQLQEIKKGNKNSDYKTI